jgi:hypothetical protein
MTATTKQAHTGATLAKMKKDNVVKAVHAGFPYLQETITILHVYPQVYADLGVIDWNRSHEEFP